MIKANQRKGFRNLKFIILGITAIIVITGFIGWSYLSKEHEEAKNLSIANIYFDKLQNGTYIGEYEGGMYQWRRNKVQVTISEGMVNDIQLIEDKADPKSKTEYANKLYERIIDAQTLQVDAICGATLTSKAYLKAVENALLKALKSNY